MKTVRLIYKHNAGAELPAYYVQTRSMFWPFWVTEFWGLDEAKIREAFKEYSNRPTRDIVKVLASK